MTTHKYQGQLIKDCFQVGIGGCTGKGWYIQTYHHPTGIQYAEEHCPHYPSLHVARQVIAEDATAMKGWAS